jgi:hypothetical protein
MHMTAMSHIQTRSYAASYVRCRNIARRLIIAPAGGPMTETLHY